MISHITGPPPRRTPPAICAKREAKIVAGGMTLHPDLQATAGAASDLVDLGGIADLKGIKVEGGGITIGAMTTHAEVALRRRAEDHPRPRPAGRRDRRSAGAQPRHHRRLGRQQRSGGGLSRGRARLGATIRTNKREIKADDFFKGMFETALAGWRDHHGHPFPEAGQGGLFQVPQPGLALRHRRRVRGQGRQRRQSGVTGAGPCAFRSKELESATCASFTPDAAKAVKIGASGLNSDLHAHSSVSRASRLGDGIARGHGGFVELQKIFSTIRAASSRAALFYFPHPEDACAN
jgi:carbon-monoxide dehydrogenase medium subunit